MLDGGIDDGGGKTVLGGAVDAGPAGGPLGGFTCLWAAPRRG